MTLFKNLLLGFCTFAITQFCWAQSQIATNTQQVHQKCAKVYWVKITLADGSSARIKTREGEMSSITYAPDGHGINITPSALNTHAGRIRLQISNITTDENKQEVTSHGAFIQVEEQGEASYANGNQSFKIEMIPAPQGKSSEKPCNTTALENAV